MDYKTLHFEAADGIGTITLDQKEVPANALDARMTEELFDVSMQCVALELRAVIVTAVGKVFCGGGALTEMDAVDDKHAHLTRMATIFHAAMVQFTRLDAPVIMAINGSAGGAGFSIALSGDYVIASDQAKFVSSYTAAGLTPDGTSTYYLAKHVGMLRAKELFLTNRVLSAQEAMDWGIVNKVVPADELMDEARKMAAKFASGPTKAFGGVKRLLDTAFSAEIETQLDRETRFIANSMKTEDAPNGIAAFLAKEAPKFVGR